MKVPLKERKAAAESISRKSEKNFSLGKNQKKISLRARNCFTLLLCFKSRRSFLSLVYTQNSEQGENDNSLKIALYQLANKDSRSRTLYCVLCFCFFVDFFTECLEDFQWPRYSFHHFGERFWHFPRFSDNERKSWEAFEQEQLTNLDL